MITLHLIGLSKNILETNISFSGLGIKNLSPSPENEYSRDHGSNFSCYKTCTKSPKKYRKSIGMGEHGQFWSPDFREHP